jgi:hypothetical protein
MIVHLIGAGIFYGLAFLFSYESLYGLGKTWISILLLPFGGSLAVVATFFLMRAFHA